MLKERKDSSPRSKNAPLAIQDKVRNFCINANSLGIKGPKLVSMQDGWPL